MALRDHFRPPLGARRHWHGFYNAWASFLASDLNRRLPAGYFAEPKVQFGDEIDVAASEEVGSAGDHPSGGPWATAEGEPWTAPAPALTIPLPILTDAVEVLVYGNEAGPTLAGAIELVSPANKDRPAHREAFVAKVVAYLQQGIGLVVVDVVTDRRANLHAELLARLGSPIAESAEPELYATSYRPVRRDDRPSLDVWQEALALGRPLPTMPLWLPGGLVLPVDLDATYDRTCRELRIDPGIA